MFRSCFVVFFFKQKTAYEMRISDWSSDVCSSDLLQFNIICHSQGCPDSRYMLAAVRDEYTGEPMYRRVASWTSMAGANKGTAVAAFYLKLTGACLLPGCRSPVLDALLGAYGALQNRALIFNKIGRASCRESVGQSV